MKAIQAHPQRGLDGLMLVDSPDPGDPGPLAIRVRVHATSLNCHDLSVATGRLPAADGRLAMADGANHGHPVIDRSFPLAANADNFHQQDAGGYFGRIVVEF